MVTSVNTNINALAAVQALNDISNNMTMTQSHIQSGLKVAGAADNPAVFTIAQGLRGNVKALSAVSDSLSTGLATLKAQISGATAISDALNTLKQTVTQGVSQTDPNAIAAVNTTITNALANIDAYAANSTINGVNLLSGTSATTMSVVSDISGGTTSVTQTTASTSTGLSLSGLSVATGGVTLSGATANAAANDTLKFTDSRGNSTTFTFVTSGTAATGTTTAATIGTDGNAYNGANNIQVVIGATSSATTGNLFAAMQANGVAASIDSSGKITANGGGVTTASIALATAAGVTSGAAATVTTALVASAAGTVGTVNAVPGNGTSAIAAVNAAIVLIGKTLSNLGAAALKMQGLSDFSSKLSDSTTTSLGAIVDANLSEESAKLASLQTKQSLAIQSLSLANQGPGALLQLFR
jgi:flagellin